MFGADRGRLTGLPGPPLLRGTRSRIPSPTPSGEALFGSREASRGCCAGLGGPLSTDCQGDPVTLAELIGHFNTRPSSTHVMFHAQPVVAGGTTNDHHP